MGDFDRQTVDRDSQWLQRVIDCTCDGGRRPEIAGFAGALLPQHGVRRRRYVIDDLDRWHLLRRGQQIIHETLRNELAVRIVGELLVECGANTMCDASHRHAAHDFRVDHGAAIVPHNVAADRGLAEIGIDRHQDKMKLEREARIHLDAAVRGRQLPAGRNLHDVGESEPRLGAGRQPVELAMRNRGEFTKTSPTLR